jgi:hypothetical protein
MRVLYCPVFHTMSERTLILTHAHRILGTFPDFTPSPSHENCTTKLHMERHTGNNSYSGRPEYVEINIANGHFVQHKSQIFIVIPCSVRLPSPTA